MTRLVILSLFLLSFSFAFYIESPSTIAIRINDRQKELYNTGKYEQLVNELYTEDAVITDGNGAVVARGPGDIMDRLIKFSGFFSQVQVQWARLGEEGIVEDLVTIEHTNNQNGEKRLLFHDQKIRDGKIFAVSQTGMD